VPFILRAPFTSGAGFIKSGPVASYLLPQTFAPSLLLALIGVAVAIVTWREDRTGVAVIALGAIAALAVAVLPSGRVWNIRYLGLWLLMLCLLGGFALDRIGRGIDDVRRAQARGRVVANPHLGAMAVPVVMLLLVPVLWTTPAAKGLIGSRQTYLIDKDQADTSTYIDHQYGGFQRSHLNKDYRQLQKTFSSITADHGCGRVQWEWNKGQGEQEEVFMLLLPYWTKGCLTSTYGLFVESSPTMPFTVVANSHAAADVFHLQQQLPYGTFDLNQGIAQMRILGVRYYFATSDKAHEAADASDALTPIASVPSTTGHPWWVYEVNDSALVEPLAVMPVVSGELNSRSSWQSAGLRWFDKATPESPLFAENGPRSWPRARRVDGSATGSPAPATRVSRVRMSDDSVSFHVDRTGTPVLVRVSYFPNWEARGAKGPWRVTPNYMVVVPTAHDVTLHYGRSGVELLGLLFTLVGVLGVVILRRSTIEVSVAEADVKKLAARRPKKPTRGKRGPAKRR
jgi:hypothetical protein